MSLPFSLLLNKDYSFSQSDLLAFRDMLRKREPAPPTLTEKIEGKKKELASMETMQDRDLDASSTSALAERIKEAKKELQDMEEEQAEQQRLEGERALLPSPIGCIPTGVLATIFLSVSEGSNSSLQQIFGKLLALTGRVTLSHPSVKLSHVCSDWRELALRTPQLWSKMDVKLPGFYPTLSYDEWCARVEAKCYQLEAWQERSAPLPVTMKLDSGRIHANNVRQYGAEAKKQYETLIDTLCESSSRWQDLDCTLHFDPVTASTVKLFDRPGAEYSALAKLRFHVARNPGAGTPAFFTSLRKLTSSSIFAAPSLDKVTIHDTWGDIVAAKARATTPIYESVKVLVFSTDVVDNIASYRDENHFNNSKAIGVLTCFLNLTSVEITLGTCPAFQPIAPPTSLPHLASMTIYKLPVTKGLGPPLDLPRLTSLRLDCSGINSVEDRWPDEDDIGQVELILQAGHELKKLTLYHESISGCSELSQCLKQLSSLVNLKLCGMHSKHTRDENVVSVLSALSQPGICPYLEKLELSDVSNYTKSGSTECAFVGLLEGKLGRADREAGSDAKRVWSNLREVQIDFKAEAKVDIEEELKARGVDMEGAELTVNYPDGDEDVLDQVRLPSTATIMDEPSPFARYIDTNHSPSECELLVLQQLVSERRAVADAMAERIGEMKAALASLEAQHAGHRKFIHDHTKLLAPIRRLPTDVLTSIFLTCVESREEPQSREYGLRMSKMHPSVIISHTCSEWRSLALHTPHLWSRIHVEIPELYDDGSGLAIAYAAWSKTVDGLELCFRAWTDRSSPCSMSLTLESGIVDGGVALKYRNKAEKKYKALIDTLCKSAHRWRELVCWLNFDSVTKAVVELFNGTHLQFPFLEDVRLQIGVECPPQRITLACTRKLTASRIFAAPRLRHLAIAGLWGNIEVVKANSPFPVYNSITNLIFEAVSVDEAGSCGSARALTLLKSFPNLAVVELSLYVALLEVDSTQVSVMRTPISLPRLTSMTLTLTPVAKGFGPSLNIPLLQSLHLTGREPWDEEPNGNAELLLQHGHQLKELTLPYETVARPTLSLCLRRVCNVSILKLCGSRSRLGDPDEPDVFLLSVLSLSDICPQLEELDLVGVSNFEAEGPTEHAFVKLLAQRRGGVVEVEQSESIRNSSDPWNKLRRIAIEFKYEQKVDIPGELRLREVDMDNLEVSIGYGGPPDIPFEEE